MKSLRAEIIVVGAGPAGISAAIASAERGADVLVLDAQPRPGGQIWRQGRGALPASAERTLRRFRALEIRTLHQAEVSMADAAFSAGQAHRLQGKCGNELFSAEAERVVLATGAMERPIPFPGWTLPGVSSAGGLQALVKGGLSVTGARVVVAGAGPLLLAVAQTLHKSGAKVLALADTATRLDWIKLGLSACAHPRKLAQASKLAASLRAIPRYYQSWPIRAEGEHGLERVILETPRGEQAFECDYLANGFGLVPNLSLPQLLGCRIEAPAHPSLARSGYRVSVSNLLSTSVPGVWCAGEGNGIGGVDVALLEGEIAGYAAAGREALAHQRLPRLQRERRFAKAVDTISTPPAKLRHLANGETMLCRCEDVKIKQLQDAGFQAGDIPAESSAACVRDIKLKTRCGMGLCQGRICGSALGFLMNAPPLTPRPPLFPLTSDELAALCEQA